VNTNWGDLREPRLGIMLHYSGEAKQVDAALVAWMRHGEDCRVSYNTIVCDDGLDEPIAPIDKRAWHAGVCRPGSAAYTYRDANSAFYGIALATGPGAPMTQFAFRTLVRLCRELYTKHGWPTADGWRITGHDREAWPRGRKIDPTGPDPRKPVLDLQAVRKAMLW
jgi:N-acetyl-anhydromuramyl-L-alanine amidase AmpD